MAALDVLRPSYCYPFPRPVSARAPVGYRGRTCSLHVRQVPTGRELLPLADLSSRSLLLHLQGLGCIVGMLRHDKVFIIVLHLVCEALRHAVERRKASAVPLRLATARGLVLAVVRARSLARGLLGFVAPARLDDWLLLFGLERVCHLGREGVGGPDRKVVEFVSSAHFI